MKGIPCRDEVNFTYTEDEIRCIVEESHRGGRLNTLENTLIKNSFDFFDLDVRDVMIPRNDMVVLDFNDDMDVMRRNISKRIIPVIPCVWRTRIIFLDLFM